jgi:hypothetical protein
MPRFMLDREVLQPPAYVARSCVLVKYRLPLLRHCFVLCHEPSVAHREPAPAELMAFFLAEAARLAQESVGDPQAYILIHSGSSIRKRSNWHLHVFVVQHRWQKAWVYAVLGVKNAALSAWYAAARMFSHGAKAPNPSIERTFHSRLRRLWNAAHVKR